MHGYVHYLLYVLISYHCRSYYGIVATWTHINCLDLEFLVEDFILVGFTFICIILHACITVFLILNQERTMSY